MKNVRLKKDGDINVLIATLIAFFFIMTLVYFAIQPFNKLGEYNELQEVVRSAGLRIEADGGLTNETTQLIKQRIQAVGLDPSKATITCNQNANSGIQEATTFGTDLKLTISYEYTYNSPKVVGFSIAAGDKKSEVISASIETTSKN
ncbi:DUF4320 family protein [Clostridium akagii]|uniref:DUF4320 family protein n=1 Tax=Clostridium akagii TaxID=91623 RepID=UPI00047BE8FC|nr:DUF4320 family protein [Clostridium akagii]